VHYMVKVHGARLNVVVQRIMCMARRC
jgi:hypothetical protein